MVANQPRAEVHAQLQHLKTRLGSLKKETLERIRPAPITSACDPVPNSLAVDRQIRLLLQQLDLRRPGDADHVKSIVRRHGEAVQSDNWHHADCYLLNHECARGNRIPRANIWARLQEVKSCGACIATGGGESCRKEATECGHCRRRC